MPSASSTSALPDCEVTARLPCLATVMPAAAAMRATVEEMLKVFGRRPVPQTSRISRCRVAASSGGWIDLARNSRAKAAISAVVSPLRASAAKVGFEFGWDLLVNQLRDGQSDLFVG